MTQITVTEGGVNVSEMNNNDNNSKHQEKSSTKNTIFFVYGNCVGVDEMKKKKKSLSSLLIEL